MHKLSSVGIRIFFVLIFVSSVTGCLGGSDGAESKVVDSNDSPVDSENPNTQNPDNSGNPPDSSGGGTTTQPFSVTAICESVSVSQSNCELHAEDMYDALQSHRYLMGEFVKVNKGKPYPTDIASDRDIEVYVNSANVEDFAVIDPDISFSGVEVNQGTIIIREVWTPDERLEKYTVMMKMEPGFYPEGGDFAYAVIKHDGTVLKGGKLDECAACHFTRANDGFLFGVKNQFKQDDSDVGKRLSHLANVIVPNGIHHEESLFLKINETAYPSELDPNNYLDVYVSRTGAVDYRRVNPEDESGDLIHVPEETVIVREVKDINGVMKSYTIMIKGPKGYYPEGGDFYYAVFNLDGKVASANGILREGALEDCGGCHNTFEGDTGFLFGVPKDNRNSLLDEQIKFSPTNPNEFAF